MTPLLKFKKKEFKFEHMKVTSKIINNSRIMSGTNQNYVKDSQANLRAK